MAQENNGMTLTGFAKAIGVVATLMAVPVGYTGIVHTEVAENTRKVNDYNAKIGRLEERQKTIESTVKETKDEVKDIKSEQKESKETLNKIYDAVKKD